jgi:hypothetical protein
MGGPFSDFVRVEGQVQRMGTVISNGGFKAMATIPFHLRYQLSRSQRLIPHLAIWGPLSLIIPASVCGVIFFAVTKSYWWLLLLPLVLLQFRGLFIGLLDVVLHPVRDMDITIEENTLSFLAGGEHWHLFLDGVTNITKYRKDVWTIQHWNGSVIHLPASEITDDHIAHIKAAAERGKTPEGVRAVVERGRLIAQLKKESDRTSKDTIND